MNILIINQPLNNRGDESAHKALVRRLLKESNVSIKVLWIDENQDSINQFSIQSDRIQYVNYPAINKYFIGTALHYRLEFLWSFFPSMKKLMHYYREADIVLNAPGGICMGGFLSWHHLFMLRIAQRLGKDIVYYGRSIGPFPIRNHAEKRFKSISISLLNSFKFIALRDSKSEQIAKELGIHNFISTVDSAFIDAPCVQVTTLPFSQDREDYCVLVPNQLLWHFAFQNKANEEDVIFFYVSIMKLIWEFFPHYKVLLLPQTFNYDGSPELRFFGGISEKIKDNKLIVLNDGYSSDEQQAIIRGSKFVIGARYHSIVFAINQAIPFIALSYEHKIEGLLNTLGADDRLVDIKSLFDNCENRLQVLKTIRNKIDALTKGVQNSADLQKRAKEIAGECYKCFKEKFLVYRQ